MILQGFIIIFALPFSKSKTTREKKQNKGFISCNVHFVQLAQWFPPLTKGCWQNSKYSRSNFKTPLTPHKSRG